MARIKSRFSTSQALLTVCLLVMFFTLLNGYLLNLVGGYQANPWPVLAGVLLELFVVWLYSRDHTSIAFDPLELAGFGAVVVGVWLYFVMPSLPTLLPPTLSMDAVRHYLQASFSYPKGTLVSWYPAGGAFVVAMVSHWTGLLPLRVLHPVAASFVALCAGAVYGMTCSLLPPGRSSKVVALAAPALLFVPWSYFAGIIDGEQYFFAQAFAQFFVVAALWYVASYAESQSGIFLVLIGAAMVGIVTAYPFLVALPLALFVIMALANWVPTLRADRSAFFRARRVRVTLLALAIFFILMATSAIALEQGGILQLASLARSVDADVGPGGVTSPSLDTLGGPLFLLLALAGIPLAWRAGMQGMTVLAFLLAWLLQWAVLTLVQPWWQVSGYRVDKTFYILVFPLAVLGALSLARSIQYAEKALEDRLPAMGTRRLSSAAAFLATLVVLVAAIVWRRPPVAFIPLSEAELQIAQWAQDHLDTYQISYLDPLSIRAYWLAFGLWRETLPNEWFQWIPPGAKMGPKGYDEWLHDDAWPPYVLVGDVTRLPAPLPQVVYRSGDAAILHKAASTPTPPKPQDPTLLYFGSTLKLLGYDFPRTRFAPGETVTATTYVESLRPPYASVAWRIELMDRDQVIAEARGNPFEDKYPLQRWPAGRFEIRNWSLPLDANISPGVYDLRFGLFRTTDGESVNAHPLQDETAKQPYLHAVPIGKVKIPPATPTPDELQKATPIQARFGDAFLLSHYALEYDRAERVARVALYWQSLAQTEKDYTVFVHVLDASGQIVAQRDAQPLDGRYPTSVWDPQDMLTERYELGIPVDAEAPYSIEIGMYTFPTLERMPVNGGGDHMMLPNVIR